MIDALEKEGLVYRKGDPEDRRKHLFLLLKRIAYREWFMEELEKKPPRSSEGWVKRISLHTRKA